MQDRAVPVPEAARARRPPLHEPFGNHEDDDGDDDDGDTIDAYPDDGERTEEEWCGSEESAVWEPNVQEAVWLVCQDPFGLWYPDTPRVFAHYGVALVAKIYAMLTMVAIVGATVLVVVFTLPSLHGERDGAGVFGVHSALAFWFTADVMLRFAAAPSKVSDFLQNVTCMLDVAAVLPCIITLAATGGEETSLKYFDLLVLRVVRLLELCMRMRLSDNMERDLEDLNLALVKSQDVLVLYLCILVVVLIVWSTAIYYLERLQHTRWDDDLELLVRRKRLSMEAYAYDTEFHPDIEEVSPFQSIMESVWWALTTLATVGYGDTVPISIGGKLVAALTMISGIFVLALPTSILGSNFIYLHRARYAKCHAASVGTDGATGGAEDDAELISQVWCSMDLAVERCLMSPEQAEYVRRSCWCEEYRRRVKWMYAAATSRSDEKLRSVRSKLRYVGLVCEGSRVLCPEFGKLHRLPELLTGVADGALDDIDPDTYVSFLVDASRGHLVHDVVTITDDDMVARAQHAVRRSTLRAWCDVHSADRNHAEEARRDALAQQRGYHATLARLDRKRSRRLARLLLIFLRYVRGVSCGASELDEANAALLFPVQPHPHLRTSSMFIKSRGARASIAAAHNATAV